MSDISAKAISAKARAMFGKRLTPEDYANMLRKQNVTELTTYLKNETSYSGTLASVQETTLHRGQLESLLHRAIYEKYTALCRYSTNGKHSFYYFYLMKQEILQILNCILLLNGGIAEKLIITLPTFLINHASFNMMALASVKSFEELLQVLIHTPYYKILLTFKPTDEKRIDFTGCETALMKFYYGYTLSLIQKQYRGKQGQQLSELFLMQAELFNLTCLFRLKHFFHVPPEQIAPCLIPFRYKISKKNMEVLLHSNSDEELFKQIENSRYSKNTTLTVSKHTFIEDYVNRVLFYQARRNLHFSNHPCVVLASFLFLCEIEVENITNIIEGVRYALPADEIRPLLILEQS